MADEFEDKEDLAAYKDFLSKVLLALSEDIQKNLDDLYDRTNANIGYTLIIAGRGLSFPAVATNLSPEETLSHLKIVSGELDDPEVMSELKDGIARSHIGNNTVN